jgi:glyoxylase-like metal-dependent hydrolase (beta-lactamase superfamily II)
MGVERAVGAYLIDTTDRLALFGCGPTSTLDALKARLRARGLERQDVGHLLLSHIHFDHAGSAGTIGREHPSVQVHVSGSAPRTSSAPRASRRPRGGSTATRWTRSGASLPRCRKRTSTSSAIRVLGVDCFPTPGHGLTQHEIGRELVTSTAAYAVAIAHLEGLVPSAEDEHLLAARA